MSIQKVLITGATGLLGQEICQYFAEKNIRVHYLTTNPNKIKSTTNSQGYYWNPRHHEIDTKALEGVTVIINLAGATIAKRWTASYRRVILESRVQSLETLLGAIQKNKNHGIEHIISASAVGIYPHSYTKKYTEDTPETGDDFLASVGKQWETKLREFEKQQITVSIARLGVILHPTKGALPKLINLTNKGVGSVIGNGKQWMSWVDSRDVAAAFIYIITHQLAGIYNVVAPNPVTNSTFTHQLAKALGKKIYLPNTPQWVLKIILGRQSDLILNSQQVSTKKLIQKGFEYQYSNLKKAFNSFKRI